MSSRRHHPSDVYSDCRRGRSRLSAAHFVNSHTRARKERWNGLRMKLGQRDERRMRQRTHRLQKQSSCSCALIRTLLIPLPPAHATA